MLPGVHKNAGAGDEADQKNKYRERQMELIAPSGCEPRVDRSGGNPCSAAHGGVDAGTGTDQQDLAVAMQQKTNGEQVEHQKPLDSAGYVKHIPFLPEGGVYLVEDQGQQCCQIPPLHDAPPI